MARKKILVGRKKLQKSRNKLELSNFLRLKLQTEVNAKPIVESSKKQAHSSREGYLILKINLFCFLRQCFVN